MLHHWSIGRVQDKECYFIFSYTFWHLIFFIIKFVFLSFSVLFSGKVSNFCNNIKQSETGIGGWKLSVELYDTYRQAWRQADIHTDRQTHTYIHSYINTD